MNCSVPKIVMRRAGTLSSEERVMMAKLTIHIIDFVQWCRLMRNPCKGKRFDAMKRDGCRAIRFLFGPCQGQLLDFEMLCQSFNLRPEDLRKKLLEKYFKGDYNEIAKVLGERKTGDNSGVDEPVQPANDGAQGSSAKGNVRQVQGNSRRDFGGRARVYRRARV